MSLRGAAALFAAAIGCLAALVTPASAAADPDPAAELFDPSRMYVIELTLPPASEAELATDPFEYQPGTFSLAETDGTPDGVGPFSAPVSVGVRLKGSASFRSLGGKSAFKIKFEGSERLRGLRILTLNNMVEDPSMIHETLAYTVFRGAGVPASRTGYAYVYVNGEDFGVHLNIETMDEIALEKLFGSFDPGTQHLYESEYDADVTPEEFGLFEIDEGDEGDRGDLEALVEAVNSSGPPVSWAERVAAVADLEEMTRMWAVEKYIGQWDGYAGSEATWLPNNYYLYSDPAGRFQMMPWGNDESWQEAYHLAFDGPAGLMFDLCLADEACRAIYRDAVAAVHGAIPGMSLDALAVQSAELLDPWQELEDVESEREEYGLEEIEEGVAETRAFIASRPAEAAEWLAAQPQPGTESPEPEGSAGTATMLSGPKGEVGLPATSLRVGRAWLEAGVLRTRMHLWARGVVTHRVTIATGDGPVRICRERVWIERPRALTLRCRLPASVLRLLRSKRLNATAATRFHPVGDDPERILRRITLPHA